MHRVVVILLVGALCASGSDGRKGARSLGMGGAYTGLANSPEAAYYNPAGMWFQSSAAGLVYYSAPFGLRELQTVTGVVSYPTQWGNGALIIESFGFELYRETTVGLTYAGSFRERMAYGVTAHYEHVRIERGGTGSTMGIDAGILTRPHNKLWIGIAGRNLNRPRIDGESLPQVLSLGMAVEPMKDLVLTADAVKDVRFRIDFRVGAEYRILNALFLRLGMSSDPSRFSAGLGLDAGFGIVDYALYTHPDLGVTHAISATIRFGRNPLRDLIPGTERARRR